MQKKRLILVLVLICSAIFCGRLLAADSPVAASCAVKAVDQNEIGDFLKELAAPPAPEFKVSCPAPYCVTNQDCINRPPGDANSTCEYGKKPTPPPGCGMCYY